MLDENVPCKDHVKTTEKKLAKNNGLLYRAKLFLDETCLKPYVLIYSFIFKTTQTLLGQASQNRYLKLASKFHVRTRKQRHICHIQWHRKKKNRSQTSNKFL